MPIIPNQFNGEKFQNKYNLPEKSFYIQGVELFCPSLPNLTDADLLDCTDTGIQYLSQESLDRLQLRNEYIATLATLEQIENTVTPTNAQVIAAVKFLAKTIRLMLKLLARVL